MVKSGVITYNILFPNTFGVRKRCFGVLHLYEFLSKLVPSPSIVAMVVGSVKHLSIDEMIR